MMFARIQSGVVVELFTPPAGIQIGSCFTPGVAAQFVAFPGGVAPIQGWTYSNGTFAPPAPAPTPAQQALAALAGGCSIVSVSAPTLNGTYSCISDAQASVSAEVISILLNGTFTNAAASIDWHDAAGVAHTFNVAQFKAFAAAIAWFVGSLRTIAATNSGTLPAQPVSIT
jgi:hypothetical protein